jgi:hypothetical protein
MSTDDRQRILVCVDDTDDLTKATSTGKIAELIANETASNHGGILEMGITRHQLLLREDIPYTSHNSAMCFAAWVPVGSIGALRLRAVEILRDNCAVSSDPGLCLCSIPGPDDSRYAPWVADCERLVAYGLKAKSDLVLKEEAYGLAESIPEVSLSEHGGTGVGVIGALAGVGLRLGGHDGRFRGKLSLTALCDEEGTTTCGALRSSLASRVFGEVQVVDTSARIVPDDALVYSAREAKPILHGGRFTIVVEHITEMGYRVCQKEDLGAIGSETGRFARACSDFVLDNDSEECRSVTEKSCRNCLYRRWVPRGFECAKTRARG